MTKKPKKPTMAERRVDAARRADRAKKAKPEVTLAAVLKMRTAMDEEKKQWFLLRHAGHHVARRTKIDRDGFSRSHDDFTFNTSGDSQAFVDCKVIAHGLEAIGFKIKS
jgi:hypothetical protein